MSTTNVRIYSLASVPAMVAHEFKCVPENGSVVAVLLNGDGELMGTGRSSHASCDGDLVDAARRSGTAMVWIVGYGLTDDVEDRQMALARSMRAQGVMVAAMLMVDGQHWRDRVSGAQGTVEPLGVVRLSEQGTETTTEPMVDLAQEAVEARVRPVAKPVREPGDPDEGHGLIAAMIAGAQDQWSDAEVASMGAALAEPWFRDMLGAGWLMQPDNDPAERARAVELLNGLVVRLDGPLAAEPLVLLALAAWGDQQVILARAALDRLASIQPGHRLGTLLRELMPFGPASKFF